MDAFTLYKRYIAMKSHFNKWNYDYFEHRDLIRTPKEKFEARGDHKMFHVLARKPKPMQILLANLSANPDKHISEILSDQDTFIDFQRRMYSISYIFQNDLTELNVDLASNFFVHPSKHPVLMRLYLAKRISIESASLLLEFSGNQDYWKEMSEGDLLFTDVTRRLVKYAPFLRYTKKENLKKMFDNASETDKYNVAA